MESDNRKGYKIANGMSIIVENSEVILMHLCKNLLILFLGLTMLLSMMTACGESNTIQKFYVSAKPYETEEEMKEATQPDQIAAGQTVYGSVNFIESPKGMEYTAKWYLDENEIKTETKKMVTDKRGVIVFSLDADKVTEGILKFEVIYGDDTLCSQELTVK